MTGSPSSPAPPVAVFDFDHTLTARDSFGLLCRWLLKRQPWRYGVALCSLPLTGPMMGWRRTRRPGVQFFVWLSTLGLGPEALEELIATRLDEFRPPLLDAALARLAGHMEQGHRVVVATGSLESLARAILVDSGLGSIEVVGSSLRSGMGGLVADRHCHGERKIEMLTERGYPPPWDYAYSDSSADIPILREARSAFLVDPRATCRARVSAALGRELEILNWRSSPRTERT